MKKLISVLLLIFNANVYAEDSKYNHIASKLNEHRNISSMYSIEITTSGEIAEVVVWTNKLLRSCDITLNESKIIKLELNDDAIAWIIGHEMGHCELGHNKFNMVNIPSDMWKQEYDADEVGKTLMIAAGFNFDINTISSLMILNNLDSVSHPKMSNRLANLYGNKEPTLTIIKKDGKIVLLNKS